MDYKSIIIRPLTTEKALKDNKEGKYAFLVNPNANKSEIKKVLQKIYGVKIEKIRTIKVVSKYRLMRNKRLLEKRPHLKKAFIQTKRKKKIDTHKFSKKK